MAILIDKANAGTAANDADGTTIAVNTTQAVASSGFIVATIGWWHASATLSSVSGGSLTWAIAVQGKHSEQNPAVAIAYAQAPSGLSSGTTITATFSTTVNARAIGITSFTGVATSSPVDTTDPVVSDNDDSWTTDSVAIQAGSVLVAAAHLDKTATSTPTSPAIEALDWGDGTNFAYTTCYRIEASAGSYTVAGTFSDSLYNVTVAAAFKASAGGGTDASTTTPAADALGDAPVPTLAAGSTVTTPAADALGDAPAPANVIDMQVTTGPASATGSAPAPTVSGQTDATTTTPAADALGDAPAPAVTGSSSPTAPAADATGKAPAPSVSATSQGSVTTPAADATGAAPAPTVTASSSTTAPTADATGDAPTPSSVGEPNVIPELVPLGSQPTVPAFAAITTTMPVFAIAQPTVPAFAVAVPELVTA